MLGATKKLDRLLTRGKEMIGQEVKTSTSDDFKQLETEMNLRHEGTAAALPLSLGGPSS